MKNETDLIKCSAQRLLTAKGYKLLNVLVDKGYLANSILLNGMLYPNKSRTEIRATLSNLFKSMVFEKKMTFKQLSSFVRNIKASPLTPIEINN